MPTLPSFPYFLLLPRLCTPQARLVIQTQLHIRPTLPHQLSQNRSCFQSVSKSYYHFLTLPTRQTPKPSSHISYLITQIHTIPQNRHKSHNPTSQNPQSVYTRPRSSRKSYPHIRHSTTPGRRAHEPTRPVETQHASPNPPTLVSKLNPQPQPKQALPPHTPQPPSSPPQPPTSAPQA